VQGRKEGRQAGRQRRRTDDSLTLGRGMTAEGERKCPGKKGRGTRREINDEN